VLKLAPALHQIALGCQGDTHTETQRTAPQKVTPPPLCQHTPSGQQQSAGTNHRAGTQAPGVGTAEPVAATVVQSH
jgi:hypothetical protein